MAVLLVDSLDALGSGVQYARGELSDLAALWVLAGACSSRSSTGSSWATGRAAESKKGQVIRWSVRPAAGRGLCAAAA